MEESILKEFYNNTSKDLSWRKDNQQKCGYMGYKETITVLLMLMQLTRILKLLFKGNNILKESEG